MPDTIEAAKAKAAATYNAAADHFDDSPLAFWDRIGERTIERLSPAPGSRILDVGCGSGASALPAAAAVGPDGRVTGVDLAERLLVLARAKAAARRLANAEFKTGDMTDLGYPAESFDAVVSVFAIFFVPDMERQVAKLWRLVRPGGALAITTWGPRMLEPGSSFFWEGMTRIRPDFGTSYSPWDRIADPQSLRQLLLDGGTSEPEVAAEASLQPLSAPEDWWRVALGSGFRWTIDQLTPDEAAALRADNLARLREAGATAVETNAIYALARKGHRSGNAR